MTKLTMPEHWPEKWANYWTLTSEEARFWSERPIAINGSVWASHPFCASAPDTDFSLYEPVEIGSHRFISKDEWEKGQADDG